ncbi:hypothetical protein L0F63_002726 [Massospora cicadina]|nr:hypothetical protein L0F63_002726 [Massospora cicadina]
MIVLIGATEKLKMDFAILSPSAKRYFSELMPKSFHLSGRAVGADNSEPSPTPESSPGSLSAASRFYNFYSDSTLARRLSNSALKPGKPTPKPSVNEIQLNLSGANADNFILVPDLLSYRELDIYLPLFEAPYRLLDYWRETKKAIPSAVPVHPSSVGSHHDRACEIFFEIKGGRVDYGKEHSRKFCHSQFEIQHEGLIPDWDESNPVVLVGKGYGAQTCLYLQYLLATDFFKCNTNASWIKGIISIEGSLSGSTLPYLRGLLPGTKTVIHPISFLQFLLGVLHLVLWLDWQPILQLFDLAQMRHWSLSQRAGASFWGALFGRSQYAYFEDNFIYDYSVEGSLWHSKLYHLSPNCLYLNYIRDGSVRSRVTNRHLPRLSNLGCFFTGLRLGRASFPPKIEVRVLGGESSSVYWENDGYLSVRSQLPPSHHAVRFNLELGNKILDPILYPLHPGMWHNVYVHHSSTMRIFQSQDEFYNYRDLTSWGKVALTLDALGISFMERLESFIEILYALFTLNGLPPFPSSGLARAKPHGAWPRGLGQLPYAEAPASTFEKTDAAGRAWARDTETRAFLQSPSSIIRWLNHSSSDLPGSSQLNLDSQVIRQALESRNDCSTPNSGAKAYI